MIALLCSNKEQSLTMLNNKKDILLAEYDKAIKERKPFYGREEIKAINHKLLVLREMP